MVFKNGEKVVVTGNGNSVSMVHHNFAIGSIVTVEGGPDNQGDYFCKNETGMHQYVSGKHLKPAFKPGDRVRIAKKNARPEHRFHIGDVVYVESGPSDKGSYICKSEKTGHIQWVNTADLEAVESAAKFSIGDKVRVTGMRGVWHGFSSGTIVKVVEVQDRSPYTIVYRCENERGDRQWVSSADLELFDSTAPGKIVVTVDGDKVLARMFSGKELLRKAEATCSKKDTFDFETGARLALDRLLDKKPESQKMFPLEDIKAGYLLVVKNGKTGEVFNVTVVTSRFDCKEQLGCVCPGKYWSPLDSFGESLVDGDYSVQAVYGLTTNMHLLSNTTDSRELLWKREG